MFLVMHVCMYNGVCVKVSCVGVCEYVYVCK